MSAAPTITATQDDATLATARKAVGDTITYTATITNTAPVVVGSTANDASGVTLTNPTPANTTDVGTVSISPVAIDDLYPQTVIGNVGINSANIPYSVTGNDFAGQNGGAVTITSFDATTANGGQIVMTPSGADIGKFTYNPPAGFVGTDTFTYTMANSVGSSTGTVRIPVAGMIWFINNNAPACTTLAAGCGRLSNPFSSVAAFQALNNDTGTNPGVNDAIFIFESATAYTGPLTLLNGQFLVGQDATAPLASILGITVPTGSVALPAMNASAPDTTITTTAASTNAIQIANAASATIRGLAIGNTTGAGIANAGATFGTLNVSDFSDTGTGQVLSLTTGTLNATYGLLSSTSSVNAISLTTVGGTLTVNNNTSAISGATGDDIIINGGNVGFIYPGTITNTAGRSLNVVNKTGGGVIFSGAITDTGAGIFLDNNDQGAGGATATLTFTGGLSLNTGANPAFTATNGGVVNVCANNPCGGGTAVVNTITTATGTALNVANTSIGASGLTFRSISAGTATNSAGNGINLDTTGALGGLTVTGNGGTCTGADQSGCSGGRIQHKNGADGNGTGNGIYLNNTSNVSLTRMLLNDFSNSAIRGLSVTKFTLLNSVINGLNGDNSAATEGAITFGTSNPAGANGLLGTGAQASRIDNCNISGAIEHVVEFYNQSGVFGVTISNSNIHDNTAASGSDGILMEMQGTAIATVQVSANQFSNLKSQGIQMAANDNSTINATIRANTITRGTQGNEGIVLSNGANGQLTTLIGGPAVGDGNTISGFGGVGIFVGQTPGNASGTSLLQATIQRNTITSPNTATNHSMIIFLSSTTGQTSQAKLLIDRNTVTQNSTGGTSRAIIVDPPDTGRTPLYFATVTNNTVHMVDAATGVTPLVVQARNGATGRFDVRANTGTNATGGAIVRVREDSTNGPSTAELARNGNGSNDPAVVLAANNPGVTTELLGPVAVINDGIVQLPATPPAPLFFAPSAALPEVPALPVAVEPASSSISEPPAIIATNVPVVPPAKVSLTQSALDRVTAEAVARWTATSLSDDQVATLGRLKFTVATLADGRLGETNGDVIRVDRDGSGQGWSVGAEATPDRVDLLTTIMHEIGHALGLPDSYDEKDRGSVMFGYLPLGERRLPTMGEAVNAIPGALTGSHFLASPVSIGTLPPGKSVKIVYSVTVGPITGNPQMVSSQGTVSGSNFTSVTTSDAVAGSGPTNTLLAIPPTFTSANATTFVVGTAGSFNVTANGAPAATYSHTGTLPSGVTLSAAGVLSGTPAAGTGGTYPITITASNGIAPNATQSFTLTVNQPAAITSANATTFTVGTAGAFTVTTTGFPKPTLSQGSTLPSGVPFVDNGDGTATLSGTPAAGTGGTYPFTITGANGVGTNATQSFTLTVNEAPAITSANTTTFVVGTAGSFTVTKSGFPAPTLSMSGTLPSGVTFTPGTGVLSGTPAAGTGGSYPLTFTASNGVGSNATQNFTLVVNQAAAITSANSTTFVVGTAGNFTVTTSGNPSPTLSMTGTLPSGVTFDTGTGVLSGTPAAGTGGTYPLTFTANNGVGSAAMQSFTLTVNQAPAITSANGTTFTVGTAGTFTVTKSGFPAPMLGMTGTLPSGVTFDAATGVLSGTPAAGTGGTYPLTFTASNGVGSNATQNFTLTVNQPGAITSASSTTFVVGTNGSFTVTTSGAPAPAITLGGAPLPSNLTFVDNGDGTGTLSGIPAPGTGGVYDLTFTASGGGGTQNFTLTVNEAPTITSANSTTFTEGNAGSFSVTANGFPPPTYSATGALPSGVTFVNGLLSGTPASGTAGNYPLQITAANGVGSDDVESFTLTVVAPVCVAPPADLVAWYPAEGNAIDVESGNNGTALNGAGFANAKAGQGFTFNGSTSVIEVPNAPAWNFDANNFTVQTWVNFAAISGNDVLVGHSEASGSVNKWLFWLKSGKLEFHLNGSAVANITSDANFAPVLGRWYHVAVTRSGNAYKFYVDGVQNGTDRFDSNTVPAANAPLTLGKAEALAAMNGSLDEVQIFSRALTSAEVQSIYNASGEGFCVDAPAPTSAVSRKTHGPAGPFDLNLPLTGSPAVECRSAGANGDHTVVVSFNNTVTEGSAAVSSGSVSGTPSFSGNTMTINLTGVPNAQQITLSLTNVKDGFAQVLPSASVSMNVLLGDTTGNKAVTASDIGQVKAESGQPISPANFRIDVSLNGILNGSDLSMTKSAAGTAIP